MRYLHECGSYWDYKYVFTAGEVSFNNTLNIANKKAILTVDKKNIRGWTSEKRGARDENLREHQLFQVK